VNVYVCGGQIPDVTVTVYCPGLRVTGVLSVSVPMWLPDTEMEPGEIVIVPATTVLGVPPVRTAVTVPSRVPSGRHWPGV
jgi:hypothetical protein